jgi:hypothetical protein
MVSRPFLLDIPGILSPNEGTLPEGCRIQFQGVIFLWERDLSLSNGVPTLSDSD